MIALNGGKCFMSVNVTQTDYDGSDGTKEEVEFLKVAGIDLTKSAVKPGKNPCEAEYKGTKVKSADRIFEAVKKFDVTKLMQTTHPLGALKVEGKISSFVDECGYEGNLLYANVQVDCEPSR